MDPKNIRQLHEAYELMSRRALEIDRANFGAEKTEKFDENQAADLEEIFLDFVQQPNSNVFGQLIEHTGEEGSSFDGDYMTFERTITLPDGKKVFVSFSHDEGKTFVIQFAKDNPASEYFEEVFENALISPGTLVELKVGNTYPEGYIKDNLESAREIHAMVFQEIEN